MKKFAMLALLLSVCTLTVGCNKPAEKKPAAAAEAAPAAAPADAAPAEAAPTTEQKQQSDFEQDRLHTTRRTV